MNIRFRAFASIMIGICLIGFAIGFLVGYYFSSFFASNYWIYLASPILGLGSGIVIYGSLFGRNPSK